ncbi:MAG: hypothetical protein AB4372_26020 [Xenococcus sp. (in: cyanobacteria)]
MGDISRGPLDIPLDSLPMLLQIALEGTTPTSVQSLVVLNAVGNSGGIDITARSLTIQDGAQILTSIAGIGEAGDINIDVDEAVTLSGISFFSLNEININLGSLINTQVLFGAEGNGGNINIKARSLSMTDGSSAFSSTQGQGDAGDILVQVDEFVFLNSSFINSAVNPGAIGNSGDIDIQARSLTITEGSQISATVGRESEDFGLPPGNGDGGNIRINAQDFVSISGTLSDQLNVQNPLNPSQTIEIEGFPGGLLVSTERGATGQTGTITVDTGDFRISDGGALQAFTANDNDAGDITINADTFEATGGGQIIATTFSSGNAGNIILNITDSITQ